MSLDIQQREHEGIVILDLKGRITVGPEATALRDRIAALTKAGHGQHHPQHGARRLHR